MKRVAHFSGKGQLDLVFKIFFLKSENNFEAMIAFRGPKFGTLLPRCNPWKIR
jgi:hypothetical protein